MFAIDELTLTQCPVIDLRASTRSRLAALPAGGTSRGCSPYGPGIEPFLAGVRRDVAAGLDLESVAALDRLRLDPEAPGNLLIRGLPVAPVGMSPPTPSDGGRPVGGSFLSEGILLGVASLLGEPFAMTCEKGGDLVHTIAPVRGREERQANDGSACSSTPSDPTASGSTSSCYSACGLTTSAEPRRPSLRSATTWPGSPSRPAKTSASRSTSSSPSATSRRGRPMLARRRSRPC
jgi:hypothetical protein